MPTGLAAGDVRVPGRLHQALVQLFTHSPWAPRYLSYQTWFFTPVFSRCLKEAFLFVKIKASVRKLSWLSYLYFTSSLILAPSPLKTEVSFLLPKLLP